MLQTFLGKVFFKFAILRLSFFTLLPLSISELEDAKLLPDKIETLVHKGSYPKAHAEDVSIERLYNNYIRLYVERDVRQIKNAADLSTFQKFMRLFAGRIGRQFNEKIIKRKSPAF